MKNPSSIARNIVQINADLFPFSNEDMVVKFSEILSVSTTKSAIIKGASLLS